MSMQLLSQKATGYKKCISVQDDISPLYVASQEGHTDVVDILLRSGADVHQTTKVRML